MGKLALVGLGTALGTTLGSLGVLAGQRSGFLPPPTTPGDPWEAPSTTGRASFDPAIAEAPIGTVSTATPGEGDEVPPGRPTEAATTATATEHETQEGPLRYLSVGEVAELLGVTNAQLEKDSDLPEPDATVARTRGWLESTIELWLGDRLAREGGRAES
ncbi:MAG: helix-turn-helix transcriptional regulator [Brevibacterium yomogidense]